jgi:hypothetical protein
MQHGPKKAVKHHPNQENVKAGDCEQVHQARLRKCIAVRIRDPASVAEEQCVDNSSG